MKTCHKALNMGLHW